MESVFIEGLKVDAEIGVYPEEHGRLQRLVIDLSVGLDLRDAGDSDALSDALDYDQLAAICREEATRGHHQLIETVAKRILDRVLALSGVQKAEVRVQKPGAVPDAETVGVRFKGRAPRRKD